MTQAEIDATVALFVAAGRRNIPVPISEWREMMATRTIGRAKITTDDTGKTRLAPVDTAPVSAKIARKAKADRLETAWTGKKVSWLRESAEEYTGKLGQEVAYVDKYGGDWFWKVPGGAKGSCPTLREAKTHAAAALAKKATP